MTEEKKKIQVVFMPGCFDDFEGTQEELDKMVEEINTMAQTGEILEQSEPLDLDEMLEEFTEEEIEEILEELSTHNEKRYLQ